MFDPTDTRLHRRIRAGGCLDVAWLTLGGTALAEMAGRAGVGAVVLDLQHGPFDRRDVEAAVAGSGVPVMLRPAENGATAIGQALDTGAQGVVVPLIESAAEAAAAVASAHYPPRGRRSAGGMRTLADFGAYRTGTGGHAVVMVMIETAEGLRNAAEIAAVPGVDMVFIGPGDLGVSLGLAPDDPDLNAACGRIKAACGAAGTPCGIFTGDLAQALVRRAEGYNLVVSVNDIGFVGQVFAEAARAFAPDRAEAAQ